MIKRFTKLLPLLAIMAVIWLPSSLSADQDTDTRLDPEQRVIFKSDDLSGSSRKLGSTDLRVDSVKALQKNSSDKVEIYPVLPYQTSLEANDPLEPQGYLELLNAADMWDLSTGSSDLSVAVIDTGFALEHEDLVDRWFINQGEFGPTATEGIAPNCTSRGLDLDKSCNNLDDDGKGFVDDWRGWDFANDDNLPLAGDVNPEGEAVAHGTVVAGMVGLTGNNDIGAASINWGVKLLPLQVFTDEGAASTVELVEAIDYAITIGVDVINLSLGSAGFDGAVDEILDDAIAAGVIVVAAAGNCGGEFYVENGCNEEGQMLYPASSDKTIAVGATNLSDEQAGFSSRGSQLDVMAPGSGSINSSLYTAGDQTSAYTGSVQGTSFSSPIVSGLVAHLLEAWPEANLADIRSMLIDTTVKPSGMSGKVFNTSFGFGRVRPLEAYQRAELCAVEKLSADINCDGVVNLLDLSVLASQWGINRTGRSDINSTDGTNLLDLSILASQWGQSQ